jgi:hypothetical protein
VVKSAETAVVPETAAAVASELAAAKQLAVNEPVVHGPAKKMIACKVCSKEFNRKENLKRHMRLIHNVPVSSVKKQKIIQSDSEQPAVSDDSGLNSDQPDDSMDADSVAPAKLTEFDDPKWNWLRDIIRTRPDLVKMFFVITDEDALAKKIVQDVQVRMMAFMELEREPGASYSPRYDTAEQEEHTDIFVRKVIKDEQEMMISFKKLYPKMPAGTFKKKVLIDEQVNLEKGIEAPGFVWTYESVLPKGFDTFLTSTAGTQVMSKAGHWREVEGCRQVLHAVVSGKGQKPKVIRDIPFIVQVPEKNDSICPGITYFPVQRRNQHMAGVGARRNQNIKPKFVTTYKSKSMFWSKLFEAHRFRNSENPVRNPCRSFDQVCAKKRPISVLKSYELGKQHKDCNPHHLCKQFEHVRFFRFLPHAVKYAHMGAPDDEQWQWYEEQFEMNKRKAFMKRINTATEAVASNHHDEDEDEEPILGPNSDSYSFNSSEEMEIN